MSWLSIRSFFRRLLMPSFYRRAFINEKVGWVNYEWLRCADCGTCFHTLIYEACPMHGDELRCGHPEDSFGGCPLPRWRVPRARGNI